MSLSFARQGATPWYFHTGSPSALTLHHLPVVPSCYVALSTWISSPSTGRHHGAQLSAFPAPLGAHKAMPSSTLTLVTFLLPSQPAAPTTRLQALLALSLFLQLPLIPQLHDLSTPMTSKVQRLAQTSFELKNIQLSCRLGSDPLESPT